MVRNIQPVNNHNGSGIGRKQSEEEVSLRVGPLVNLAPLVRVLGCDPDPIFRQSGFCLEEFQDTDHRVPYRRGSQLLANCVEATGCEHLGLMLGERTNSSHLGIPGFLVSVAPNVEQALLSLVKNLDLHDDGGVAQLEIGAEYTSFGYSVQLPGTAAVEQIHDLSVAVVYKIMSMLCGQKWNAASVMLERREPSDDSAYRRFFRAPIHFNSTENAITFQSKCLKNKPPAADEFLYKHLETEARLLHELQHHEFMEELPAALRKGLLSGHFAASNIAEMFGMHERTLHRRLLAAGTSFRQELDLARQSVSQQLLGNTSLSVGDIASAMGYADSSGFIRAFQRWSGTSPASWRKQNSPRRREQTQVTR